MLKPRYRSFSESVQDFNRMLDGMNAILPLERKVDEDLLDFLRAEQEMARLEQQIEHAYRAIYGSGMPISEAETDNIRKIHAHAAAAYESAAEDLMAMVRKRTKELEGEASKVRTDSLAKMKAVHDKFIAKKRAHEALANPSRERKTVVDAVNESAQPKMSSTMRQMRILAGLEESATFGLPRDPGVLGTTRFNEGYAKMAEPFAVRPSTKGHHHHDIVKEKDPGEKVRLKKSIDFVGGKNESLDECDCDDERAEKKDIKKIKKSADRLDDMHKNVKESKQWAAAAVKHPGRLHKHFGVPEGKKIPMSKIKAEYNRLKDKEDKTAEEKSLMRALALGIRFKGGDVPGGEKKKGLAGD